MCKILVSLYLISSVEAAREIMTIILSAVMLKILLTNACTSDFSTRPKKSSGY